MARHKKLDWKGWATIGISCAAFMLSAVSFYFTTLRVTDDVRVIVGDTPMALPDFEKGQFEVNETAGGEAIGKFIFINSGTRSAVISGVTLHVAQPGSAKMPVDGCDMSDVAVKNFDMEPFVLKPGDIIVKNTRLARDAATPIKFSEVNEKSEKVQVKVCVEVAFTTPNVEYSTKTVSEYEDELNRNVLGYLFTRGASAIERRPVQLFKKSWFVWD